MVQKLRSSRIGGCIRKAIRLFHKPKTERAMMERKKQNYLNGVLLFAADRGNNDDIERLLKAGADINAKDDFNRTVLMYAIRNISNIKTCALLIGKGVDVNAKNKNGETALMSAASRGNIRACRLLIENGAKTDVFDNNMWTAPMYAIKSGHSETASFIESMEFLQKSMDKENFKSFMLNFDKCTQN
ncbi:MAG: ankyrin repeat domain-containing protein [Candidatus Micrarchaeota archaeon]|nr:ankyrin repeat domain-containing protein [Candidatus Micrarchaeota archaeon]